MYTGTVNFWEADRNMLSLKRQSILFIWHWLVNRLFFDLITYSSVSLSPNRFLFVKSLQSMHATLRREWKYIPQPLTLLENSWRCFCPETYRESFAYLMCVNSTRWLLLERLFPLMSLCSECLWERQRERERNFFTVN